MVKKLFIFFLSVLLAITFLCSCVNNGQTQNAAIVFENIDGYEYAKYNEYNSPAEENGLGGTKIYTLGKVTSVGAEEDVAYAMLDCSDGIWNILFGFESTDEISEQYLNKEIYAFGSFLGYSESLKSPTILLDSVKCDGNSRAYNKISDFMQSNEPSTNTTPKSDGSYVLETNQIDYRTLSKDEFADKIAHDFSTSNITFTVNRYSELTYFLKPAGTNQLIDADISFFDFGYEFALTLPTTGDTDECYDILSRGLKSELFGISFDDQVDILAHYKVDEINYESDGTQPFTITESKSDKFNMIYFQFKH